MSDDELPGSKGALRVCAAVRRAVWSVFHWGIIGSFALGFLTLWANPEVGLVVAFTGMFFAFLLILALSLFRVALVLIYFARFSTLQVLYVVMGTGTLLTLATTLPGEWRVLPVMALLGLVFFLLFCISEMDPTGDNRKPRFFLKAVAEQKRRRKAEQQKIQELDTPGDNPKS